MGETRKLLWWLLHVSAIVLLLGATTHWRDRQHEQQMQQVRRMAQQHVEQAQLQLKELQEKYAALIAAAASDEPPAPVDQPKMTAVRTEAPKGLRIRTFRGPIVDEIFRRPSS